MAVLVPETSATLPPQIEEPRTKGSRLSFLRGNFFEIHVPLGIFVLICLACFLAPSLFHIVSPVHGFLLTPNLPPFSPGHILGTNSIGADLLSQCLFGGRISLEVGFGAVAVGFLIGGFLGTVVAYFGGILETIVMRILDVLLAFPSLVLAMAISTYLGQSERNVIIAIAFFTIPAFARLSRATTLKVREADFVVAGRLSGRPAPAMIVRHIVPNIVPQLLTFGLLTVAAAMLIEAALSFLGLSVPAPQPTWGGMIAAGQNYLSSQSYLVLEPAFFLFVTILVLNRLGDALRVRWAMT